MFGVPIQYWAQYATLHFNGNAALWLQTYEAQHSIDGWVELCLAVERKFGKDLYHNYMRELLNLKQLGSVQEYYEKFESSMHKVLVHNNSYDDVFFVNRFVDGLKSDVRAAIMLHKPRTVDVALSLALLQEEALEIGGRKNFSKHHSKGYNKYSVKMQPSTDGSSTY